MERTYKIKNLLKELLTYSVLYKRDVNKIESNQCIRCKNGIEDWEHLYKCESNELTIREVLERSLILLEEILGNKKEDEKLKWLREINLDFIKILYEKSEILNGKEKFWELIRGVYNKKFDFITKDKEGKKMVEELWEFCYEELKNEFWKKRYK